MQEISRLRTRIPQLATERQHLSEQRSTLFTRRTELEEIISQANAALNDRAKHWHEENSLKAQRDAAKIERSEVILEIQSNERKDLALAGQERDCRQGLAQAEYLSTTTSDVRAEIEAALVDVRDADARLASLAAERASLTAKRGLATRASAAVRAAEGELVTAGQAQEAASGQAFIAGREVDLVMYSARVAKAEKRLDDAKREAAAGVAALPMIADRLDTLAGMIDDATKSRGTAIKSYWHARTRLLEIKYREQVEELIETVGTMRALGRKTGRQLGSRLYESVQGLRVPTTANDEHPQPVKLVEPDDGALLSRFERELETALFEDELETV